MLTCTAKTNQGTDCKSRAVQAGFCTTHASRLVEARETRPNGKVHGIPHLYTQVYQEFLDSPKPFDVSRELAAFRTLHVELRDTIEGRLPLRVRSVAQGIDAAVRTRVIGSEMALDDLMEIVSEEIESSLLRSFAIPLTSTEELKDVGDLLSKIVRAAETMKKIQEGVKLDVTINSELVIRILQMAVFPVIPEPERRQRILSALQGMALGPLKEQPALPDVSHMARKVPNIPVPSVADLLASVPIMVTVEDGERLPVEIPVWEDL